MEGEEEKGWEESKSSSAREDREGGGREGGREGGR
jgi:hypothetical protein